MSDSPETPRTNSAARPEGGLIASVEYSREAMEHLRFNALDGLMALPRVGIGIGGFLLGTFVDGALDILDFVEIPCGHQKGPSFNLSSEEVEHAIELAAQVDVHQVVGLYCTKTRGAVVPGEADLALFDKLCQKPWQVMLVIRPSTVQESRAALFRRGPDGLTGLGSEWDLLPLGDDDEEEDGEAALPPPPAPAPAAVSTPPPAPIPAPPPVVEPSMEPSPESLRPFLVPENPAASELRPAAHSDAPPAPHHKPELFAEEIDPADQPNPRLLRKSTPVVPPIPFRIPEPPPPSPVRRFVPALLALILLAGAATTAWMTRFSWLPRPELKMEAIDNNRHVTLRWNADAVRGLDDGHLFVNDGGESHTFNLTRQLLEAGQMGYDRTSPRVTATLRVGETRAIASYFEPVPALKPLEEEAPPAPRAAETLMAPSVTNQVAAPAGGRGVDAILPTSVAPSKVDKKP